MDFSLTDIQQMMQESAARFVQNEYDFETRRQLSDSEQGFSDKNWSLFAELGWLALGVDEAYGGLGGDLVDAMVLQQELGKGLVLEPVLSTCILGAPLLQALGSEAQKQELLQPVVAGELKLALAFAEPEVGYDVSQTATRARPDADGYVLNGHKAVVLGAQSAGLLLVVARSSGTVGGADGISVFLVDPHQSGVRMRPYTTNDGYRAAEVWLDNVQLPASALLGQLGQALPAISQVLAQAMVLLCAEAVGIMEKLLGATVEYVKTREQFGQKICRFQVVQHRLADMFMESEQSRSLLYYAAMQVAEYGADAPRIASMLKVKIGTASRLVGQAAVQLHGGMGITDELDVGHFFKRLTSINCQLGSRDYHLQRLVNSAF